jgi:mono/diheme cytochrome c family protein
MRVVVLCALLAVAALAWLLWRGSAAGTPSETKGAESSAPPSAAVLERGAYLVRVGACMGCHTAQGGVVLAGEARCARRLACSMRRI